MREKEDFRLIKARVGEATYFFNSDLELYFRRFKQHIIGHNQTFSAFGSQKLLYADWTASGRLYKSIEEKLTKELGPFVGNTHTESNITGTYMTKAYEEAKTIIKSHVHANEDDILLFAGFGMTAVVNKLQRMLGLKQPKKQEESERTVVFVTHMEHHSNYLSWIETNADVEMVSPDSTGEIDYTHLEELLKKYKHRKQKIGAFTACSNVTGRKTDYHRLASIMHAHNGLCFIDFSASAPYVEINMHPSKKGEQLDAIYFSPHKFLGGPGTSGVLIMNKALFTSKVPDLPGGGTVDFTNQWGDILYKKDIEEREDGGTPGFLQGIKTALAIKLKENMGIKEIEAREKELVEIALSELAKMEEIEVLDCHNKNRLGIISFIAKNIHYDLMVRLLNDRFGIQVRGGCSCAGPYGHHLLHVTKEQSKKISQEVMNGDFSHKPGWVRLSLHPTMSNEEVYTIIQSIKKITLFHKEWGKDYSFCEQHNEYDEKRNSVCDVSELFDL